MDPTFGNVHKISIRKGKGCNCKGSNR